MTKKKNIVDDLLDSISEFGAKLGDTMEELGLGDLFGTPSETAAQKPKVVPTAEEAHREGLLSTFRHRKNDEAERAFLKDAVGKYAPHVLASSNDELLTAHAKAAVWVEDLATAAASFEEVQKQTPRLHEARGLVLYTLKRFPSASTQFRPAEDSLSNPGRLAYAAALFQNGSTPAPVYQTLLAPLLERHAQANAILGIVAARTVNYDAAERYLRRAVEMNPHGEQTQLDLMRVLVLAGKKAEAYALTSPFYVQTGSQRDQTALNGELEGRMLTVRPFKIANLSAVIDSLV